MNILLLSAQELDASGHATLVGRRAEHAHLVLHARAGDTLAAGLVDGPLGKALIEESTRRSLRVRFLEESPAPPLQPKTLILGIPRPKVLSRCLEHAATLGFGRICLVRTARVEKSQLESRTLTEDNIRRHLLLGLEQGRRTFVPAVDLFPRLADFLESSTCRELPDARVVAHQDAEALADWRAPVGDYALVIGPEGGLLEQEVEAFAARGFAPRRFGATALRVESALSYVSGQLDLLAGTRPG